MSNLGTIYELNLNKCTKNKYPVVYFNDTYYYYKKYGDDMLDYRRKNTTYPLDLLKKSYMSSQKRLYGYVYLYIPKGITPDFSFINGFSHEELSASEEQRKEQRILDTVEHQKKDINFTQTNIERLKKAIQSDEIALKIMQNELILLQDELLRFREKKGITNEQ